MTFDADFLGADSLQVMRESSPRVTGNCAECGVIFDRAPGSMNETLCTTHHLAAEGLKRPERRVHIHHEEPAPVPVRRIAGGRK